MDQQPRSAAVTALRAPTSRRHKLARAAALIALLLTAGACSLIVQRSTDQCQSDKDCEHFGGHPLCQQGLCVATGLGPPGCFYGDAGTADQIQNQCTTAQCLPFDNCMRLHLCNGAALPQLIPPTGH